MRRHAETIDELAHQEDRDGSASRLPKGRHSSRKYFSLFSLFLSIDISCPTARTHQHHVGQIVYRHSNNWVFHFYRKVIPIEAKVYTDRGKMLYQFEEKGITLVGPVRIKN